MGFVIFLIIVASTIWVGVDSSKLGARRGILGGGMLDMGVASWVICCFFLWIITFPCYLATRPKLLAFKQGQLIPYTGQLYVQPVLAPPQYSPDGRWWWTGQQWVAVQPQQPHVGWNP